MTKRAPSESTQKASPDALRDSILNAWKTNARVTAFLVEHLPAEFLAAKVPGSPRKTIRMLAAHIHNCRCGWTRTLGKEFGIAVPESVDRFKVTAEGLVLALGSSSDGILSLLKLGCEHGGTLPAAKAYVWRNLPLDVGHVLSYFVAHEGHHRGQIVMLARELGYELPASVNNGLWDFTKWAREQRGGS
jgi:uncharacterized damage-inducible protein DinB